MESRTLEFMTLTGAIRASLHNAGRVFALVLKADVSKKSWRPSFVETRVHHKEVARLLADNVLVEVEGTLQFNREHATVVTIDREVAQLRAFLEEPGNSVIIQDIGIKNRVSMALTEPAFFAKFLDPFIPKSVVEAKDGRSMSKNRQQLALGAEFKASVCFVALPDLKKSDPSAVAQSLQRLHEIVARLDVYVLASVSGLILVSPDGAGSSLDEIMAVLGAAKGIPYAIRVGITHGDLEVVRDVDGQNNLISPSINIAARLAFSSDNDGALVHESYVRMYGDTVPKGHCLSATNRETLIVKGKAHDPEMSVCRWGERFEPDFGASLVAGLRTSPAMLLAYDLSGFSKGDRAQLSKRFNAVTTMFDRIRSGSPMKEATIYLSPGGDGGILVITRMSPSDVAHVPERLRELGAIASIDMGPAVSVRVRVGVHYGAVTFYRAADGVERPSGRALLVTDAIAGDEIAREHDGVIVTAEVVDSLVTGSKDRLKEMYEQLTESDDAVLKGITRFVRRS